jgi:hypothetical protein
MKRTTLISLVAAVLLAGCSDGAMLGPAQTSPKRAAALCNGDDDRVTPTQDEARIVAAFHSGEISFNECMQRLRG